MNQTPLPPNARGVASARATARSSQSRLPKQTDGGQSRTNKGKSKSGKGKDHTSASGPVTHDTLLADVVRTLVAHEDEILALKFNHSFLMYASITEQESIVSHHLLRTGLHGGTTENRNLESSHA